MLPEYVWDAGVLEGNPFTFPVVKTLLEGVTVGGAKTVGSRTDSESRGEFEISCRSSEESRI